jgi:hypothetical protein
MDTDNEDAAAGERSEATEFDVHLRLTQLAQAGGDALILFRARTAEELQCDVPRLAG